MFFLNFFFIKCSNVVNWSGAIHKGR